MKSKACVITASRSEYGLLRWVMEAINNDSCFDLQVIATGAHLSPEYGLTYREIEKDGFEINAKVEMLVSADTATAIAKSMGLCAIGLSDALDRLAPDFIIVLGDRYELLPVCSTALLMRIPIVHISGGDITEGAIDNEIRNAVSQMATLHFPGTKESANHLEEMGIPRDRIVVVGEPGLDAFRKMPLLSRAEISEQLGLNISDKWILLTYHPETKKSPEENLEVLKILVQELLDRTDAQIIATYANADEGGRMINAYLEEVSTEAGARFKVSKSLGQQMYISLMNESALIAGNSSSGIIEAPIIGVPVLNIGNRQKGRHLCKNIVTCASSKNSIQKTIDFLAKSGFPRYEPDFYYGNGNTGELIASELEAARIVGERL